MSYGELSSLLLSPIQTKNIWWPNILSFGHLAWCCLLGFGKIWSPSNIRSKSIKPRYYSRVWCALFGSFGRLKQTSLARACVLRCRLYYYIITFDQSYSKLHSFFSISIPKKYFVSLAESKISLFSNRQGVIATPILDEQSLFYRGFSVGGKGHGQIQNGGCPVVDDVPLAHLPDRLQSCPRFSRCDLERGESFKSILCKFPYILGFWKICTKKGELRQTSR